MSILYTMTTGAAAEQITEHMMSTDAVCEKFNVDVDRGLSEDTDVPVIRDKYGYNEYKGPAKATWRRWAGRIISTFFGGFIIITWAGAIMCFLAWATQDKDDYLYLGATLVGVITTSSAFTLYHLYRSDAITSSFKKMVPPKAQVTRDGKQRRVLARELVPGDVVNVVKGNRVPADIRIIRSTMFTVDENILGRGRKIRKHPGITSERMFEASNLAFSGTLATTGKCVGVVLRVGENSMANKALKVGRRHVIKKTPIHSEMKYFRRIITLTAILLGIVFGGVALAFGYSFVDAAVFMLGIMVANVPEGLRATLTVAKALCARRMAKRNCLVQNMEAVETIGAVSVILVNKTGLVTQDVMTPVHVLLPRKPR